MTRSIDLRPFLSVVTWPPDHGRELVARLLADSVGADRATFNLRLGAAPPSVIGQFDSAAVQRGLAALHQAGGDGFAVTLPELERLGPSHKIRDLRLVEGGAASDLEVDIWRGPTTRIRREDVRILVRAHLRDSKPDRLSRDNPSGPTSDLSKYATAGLAYGVGGAMGMAIAVGAAYAASGGGAAERQLRTSDKLDIHTSEGTIYQIDGDKFGYRILGDMRGYGDKTNMDSMCELLAHVAPREIVDPYFELWNPPPGFDRLRLPGLPGTASERAFAFYSRWAATMYRYLLATDSDY